MRGVTNRWRMRAWAGALLAAALVVGLAVPAGAAKERPLSPGSPPAAPSGSAKTLVLYDSTGPWGHLGEMWATQVANLVSRFGSSKLVPVVNYSSGMVDKFTGVVYVGSTYGEPLPDAFKNDVVASTKPVVWLNNNLDQLGAWTDAWAERFGFRLGFFVDGVNQVDYAGQTLTRNPTAGPVWDIIISDPGKATPLGEAVNSSGGRRPWAVRSGNFVFVDEVPLTYVTETDRYLAFADLLIGVFQPSAPERHRALVRLEDIGPMTDPESFKAAVAYLASQKIPFSFGVYTRFVDPLGVTNRGSPLNVPLKDAPAVVAAIKYALRNGGTMIHHGWTHQYADVPNPYDGVSGDDFEFYRAHVDANDLVVLDGPVPEDSTTWALGRIDASQKEFKDAGLPVPKIFEFPHYAGSVADYLAVRQRYTTRYERSLYPYGAVARTPDYTKQAGQFFPYLVRDVYGSVVVPENLGNIEPEPYNQHPARLPADLIAAARANLVVRDGVASFFFHPYLDLQYLKETVEGLKALGYTFVAPASL